MALEQAQNTANHESSKESATTTTDTTANKTDFRASSIATVRYVNDGVGGIVSSIVIRAQAASTAIHSKAKTTVENIQVYTTHTTAIFCCINCLYFICWLSLAMQSSEWAANASKWAPPALKKYVSTQKNPATAAAPTDAPTAATPTEDTHTTTLSESLPVPSPTTNTASTSEPATEQLNNEGKDKSVDLLN